MRNLKQLLEILSDSEFHSGEAIATQLNMTRAGVWKIVKQAQTSGFDIEGVTRHGYRLISKVVFLCPKKIKRYLSIEKRNSLKLIEVFDEIDSTNTYLLQKIYEYSKIPRVCLAESQTQGRGRRGRVWHSPFGQNIYLSLLWKFNTSTHDFQGLSLVIAVAIATTLEQLNLPFSIKLKWPNDVFIHGKKAAGILIETRGEMHDGAQVVIGIGINVNMKKTIASTVSQPWVSLSQLLHQSIDRNKLTAKLIHIITEYLQQFDSVGFAPFKTQWEKYDMTMGQSIKMDCHNTIIQGKACGIDRQGRLKIETQDGKCMAMSVGDVSLISPPK